MSKYTRKQRDPETIDYREEVEKFLAEGKQAFIPDKQTDTNRYKWHCIGEQLNIATRTLKLWRAIPLCGIHKKPIVRLSPSADPYDQTYDSDYECDYETNDDEYISCYRETTRQSKLRTVVIFNAEASKVIEKLSADEVKEYLVTLGLVSKESGRYTA